MKVRLDRTQWKALRLTDSQHYRYIVGLPNGSSVERVDPFARLVVFPNFTEASRDDSDAHSMVTSRNLRFGAPFNAPGWNELVIYQLHVGTFYDQNHPGVSKIKELISQIPYLKDLGVNAVQFLPYSEFSAKSEAALTPGAQLKTGSRPQTHSSRVIR